MMATAKPRSSPFITLPLAPCPMTCPCDTYAQQARALPVSGQQLQRCRRRGRTGTLKWASRRRAHRGGRDGHRLQEAKQLLELGQG